jgi:hypothetical protein
MANNPEFERFREISWRRALTNAELGDLETWLAAHPEFRAEWEAEMALSTSLMRLPAPEVPSNFTARVLQAVERDAAVESRTSAGLSWWQALTRKARWASAGALTAIIALVGVGIHQRQVQAHELALANRMREFSKANTEVLANFETIKAINQGPAPDDQLLALLE